jgi:hypothetical protein
VDFLVIFLSEIVDFSCNLENWKINKNIEKLFKKFVKIPGQNFLGGGTQDGY